MIEAAVRRHEFAEHILARVAERRVAKIMGERKRLGEIVIEAKRAGERAGNLTDFERMGESCPEMIALVRNKDLCLMGEPPEGRAMDDAVAVTLKDRARWRSRLRDQPATASRRIRGIGSPEVSQGGSRRKRQGWHEIPRETRPHSLRQSTSRRMFVIANGGKRLHAPLCASDPFCRSALSRCPG